MDDPKAYDYQLPKSLIAQKPINPRHNARLLAYDKNSDSVKFDKFINLAKHLPKNAVLVFNQTRVIPARLLLQKPSGGLVEILLIGQEGAMFKALSNKNLPINSESCVYDGRHKHKTRFMMKVIKKTKGTYWLKLLFPKNKLSGILMRYGITPLPPYMKHSPLTEPQRRKAYQTIFAKTGNSVAAPTASLHFTPLLLKNLKMAGIETKFIRLDVNLGTFAKLTNLQLKAGRLHFERYFIDKKTADFLMRAKKMGRPIIAVGTTVARTLETAFGRQTRNLKGLTDLFIRPGYKFKIIDGLITNFHVPQSSLIMLVSALTGREKLLKLYSAAVKKRFRFFSFGDGMLIL